MTEVDPLGVPCPRCKAPIGLPCARPNGDFLPPESTHRLRITAAEVADAPVDAAELLEDRESRDLYRSLVATLEVRGDLVPWTRMLAFRVAQNAEEARKHYATAQAQPVVLGSTGQKVMHPLWTLAVRLEERVLTDLKALRCTPDSAGWVKGDEAPKDDLDDLDELAAKRSSPKRAAG